MTDFSPREIVSELDRFIVGQADAKRAVSIALRNRWRRQQLEGSLREEVLPKNILMIGPTGVGKTEIARRLAKLANAPSVTVWGSGTPKREFLYSEDMADACVYLMSLPDEKFVPLLGQNRNDGLPPLMNIGVGHDLTIRELAETVKDVIGYAGTLEFDASKPEGTPRKLMDVGRLNAMGWKAQTAMRDGLARAYADFLQETPAHGHRWKASQNARAK